MAIKKPIPITFNLDSRQSVQSVCAVIHIDDKNTETLDLSLMQGGEHIAVSPNSTVTARFVRVKDKILISDNVPCAVQENGNIHIPIDNAAAHMLVGEIKIEINIVDENDILTMQFPLVIKVNNTILADAEISPESEGTIPELLEEAKEAAESATQAAEAATEAISAKQDKLTAGENITITEENVISASSGSNDYTELENKPSINNVTLSGNKSSDDLSLQGKLTAGNNITINNGVISANGGVTDYDELENKPQINGINGRRPVYYSLLGAGLQFEYNKFYVQHLVNNVIYITLSHRIPYVTYLGEYDFNNLESGQFGNTSYVVREPSALVLNFPEELDIDRTKLYFISGFTHGADYNIAIRKVIGCSKTGEYKEYAQIISQGDRISGTYTYEVIENTPWVELTGGGSQIVSGEVNANGTITFTNSEGNSFTTSGESVIGPQGAPGQDYVLTAQDKTDIANIVLSELPTTQGVLYGNQSN